MGRIAQGPPAEHVLGGVLPNARARGGSFDPGPRATRCSMTSRATEVLRKATSAAEAAGLPMSEGLSRVDVLAGLRAGRTETTSGRLTADKIAGLVSLAATEEERARLFGLLISSRQTSDSGFQDRLKELLP